MKKLTILENGRGKYRIFFMCSFCILFTFKKLRNKLLSYIFFCYLMFNLYCYINFFTYEPCTIKKEKTLMYNNKNLYIYPYLFNY